MRGNWTDEEIPLSATSTASDEPDLPPEPWLEEEERNRQRHKIGRYFQATGPPR